MYPVGEIRLVSQAGACVTMCKRADGGQGSATRGCLLLETGLEGGSAVTVGLVVMWKKACSCVNLGCRLQVKKIIIS